MYALGVLLFELLTGALPFDRKLVIPNPDPTLEYPAHQELITRNGICLLENLDLRALAADQVFEFLFIFSPTRFKGATGSPGGPLAIR